MGIVQNSEPGLPLTYYATDRHSVEGQVEVYRLKGETLFVFRKEHTSPDLTNAAHIISAAQCQSLCPYFGGLIQQKSQSTQDQSCLCRKKDLRGSTFWSYQNFTLRQEIESNNCEGRVPSEDKIWSLMASMASASMILISHKLFVDCTLDNVHLSPLKNYQLYWGKARPGNGHRLYYKTLMGQNDDEELIMSPEELKGVRKGKISARIDLEKCVMHSLGVMTVMFANGISNYSLIYDYERQQIRVNYLLALICQSRINLGNRFSRLLSKMVAQSPADRFSFQELQGQLSPSSQLDSSRGSTAKLPELQTCGSSKISLKNIRL